MSDRTHVVTRDTTRDGTHGAMRQSQSQSQSQNPFLSLTADSSANHRPASTTDRAGSAADNRSTSTFNAHAASRDAHHQEPPVPVDLGLPIIENPALREDHAYLVTGTTDHFVVGTRRLTDAEFAGVWIRWWVRREYFATGHLATTIQIGKEPTRDNVSLFAQIRAEAA